MTTEQIVLNIDQKPHLYISELEKRKEKSFICFFKHSSYKREK